MARPSVNLLQGALRGKFMKDYLGGGFSAFLGIPYAQPPVGELRFKAPKPAKPWDGVREASKEGPECPSKHMFFGKNVGKEDNCLCLNVYTKELPFEKIKKKPVMVWIHGGAFCLGSNNHDIYGPEFLMTQDIVLVSINYRLAIFGFLSLENPSLGVPGNAGLKDQVMALKWVQKNIESFNGDPNNVTLIGESAGSASVHYLMLSPTTKGLFHKVILQSGVSMDPWARGKRNALEAAKCLKYTETDEESIYEKLKNESTTNLIQGFFKIRDRFLGSEIRPFCPVIEYPSEEAFLTEDPLELLKSGRYHKVPMIIGYNSLEGMVLESYRRARSKNHLKYIEDLELEVPHYLNVPLRSEDSKKIANEIKDFYYNGKEISKENLTSTLKLVGDVLFTIGTQRAIKLHKQTSSEPIYVYRNNLEGPLNWLKKMAETKYIKIFLLMIFLIILAKRFLFGALGKAFYGVASKIPAKNIKGVCHGDDTFYAFSNMFSPKIDKGSDEDKCIQIFVKMWTNFAKNGNPNLGENNLWTPVDGECKKIQPVLSIDRVLEMHENVDEDRFQFWENIIEKYSRNK